MNQHPITTILIVDDQLENLQVLSALLKQNGYLVRKTNNPQLALTTSQIEPPDLILLDVRMPQMSGYEVCTHLKSNSATQSIPIIFLSALDEAGDKIEAFRVGGADYITKPFQSEEVLIRIAHHLTLRKQQQQILDQNQQLHEQQILLWQQAEQLRQFNTELEKQVYAQTQDLKQALEFEATLKGITDRVRESLDEHDILQTAIEALGTVLGVKRCDTTLYDALTEKLTICHRYPPEPPLDNPNPIRELDDAPIAAQLRGQSCFAFCPYPRSEEMPELARLICPISSDEQVTLGHVWLFQAVEHEFDAAAIRLTQQVANQCAIALRQARLYKSAQRQVEELARLNQLKDDFLNTVSHELRTPLATIEMATQMLEIIINQAGGFTGQLEPAEPLFRTLQLECQREAQLINDLLDLTYLNAHIEPLTPTAVQMTYWLPYVLEAFQARIQTQHQSLQVNIPTDLPVLLTDQPTLERIVMELMNNACKYTPAGEQITVSVEVLGDRLQVQVTNSGVEIPADELPRIFDRFYRIPSNDPWKHEGTGLGLALIQRMVEYLGGTIQATSTHQITCFTVTLPLITASSATNLGA